MINSHFSPTSDVSQASSILDAPFNVDYFSTAPEGVAFEQPPKKGTAEEVHSVNTTPGFLKSPRIRLPEKAIPLHVFPLTPRLNCSRDRALTFFVNPFRAERPPRTCPRSSTSTRDEMRIQTPAPMFSYVSKDWSSSPHVVNFKKFSETDF